MTTSTLTLVLRLTLVIHDTDINIGRYILKCRTKLYKNGFLSLFSLLSLILLFVCYWRSLASTIPVEYSLKIRLKMSKYILKRSISIVKMSMDWSTVEEVTDLILPAGCLAMVQEKSHNDRSKQIVAECLEEFRGLSNGLFIQAMENDLIEISLFALDLLLAEKHFDIRLIFCRDENWLEEAVHIGTGSDVLVTYGAAQFRGVVRYLGAWHPRHPDKLHKETWFGVALTHSNLELLRQLVPAASDGFPHFQCEQGRGLYVTICSVRLADVLLTSPYPGKKPFSSRSRKSAALETAQKRVVRKSFNMKPGWSETFDVAGKRSQSGALTHGTRATSANCDSGCGVSAACTKLAPVVACTKLDDTADVQNVVEYGGTVVENHGPVRPQHDVASNIPVAAELLQSPPHHVPSVLANPRPPLLPTPPPHMGQFEVKLLERVFTYVNNQKVFGTVVCMNPAAMEIGVQYDTIDRGARAGIDQNGGQLLDPHQPWAPLMQPTSFPVGVPFQPMMGGDPPPTQFPNMFVFSSACPVIPVSVESPPRPASRKEVEETVRQADEKERALLELQSCVESFRLQMEEKGVLVSVDVKDTTKGYITFLPKTDEPYIVEHIAAGLVRTRKNIQFFPPFFLRFVIPHGYPDVPPVFRLECNYVPAQSGVLLTDAVLNRWHECKRNESPNLLYDTFHPIHNVLLELLGFPVCITITSSNVSISGFVEINIPGLCTYATDQEARDVFNRICRYNDRISRELEEREKVKCSVCMDFVSLVELSAFSRHCQHLFCRDCITGHVRAQVDQGNTAAIHCPSNKCEVRTSLLELADVVDSEVFNEFDGKLLDQSLACMNDVMRCPHCNHPVVFEPDILTRNERYIKCPAEPCGKLYCPSCRGKDHGDQPCMTFAQKREVRNAYVNGTEEEKARLEHQYGKDNIKHATEDFDAEEIIRNTCKLCPQCKAPTEKTEGCNHLTCIRCHTHFCWLCGEQLPAQDPYRHFRNGRCDMYRQGLAAATPGDGLFRPHLFDQPMVPPRVPHGHRDGYMGGDHRRLFPVARPREQHSEDNLRRHNELRRSGAPGHNYAAPVAGDRNPQRLEEREGQMDEQAWLHPELYIFE